MRTPIIGGNECRTITFRCHHCLSSFAASGQTEAARFISISFCRQFFAHHFDPNLGHSHKIKFSFSHPSPPPSTPTSYLSASEPSNHLSKAEAFYPQKEGSTKRVR